MPKIVLFFTFVQFQTSQQPFSNFFNFWENLDFLRIFLKHSLLMSFLLISSINRFYLKKTFYCVNLDA